MNSVDVMMQEVKMLFVLFVHLNKLSFIDSSWWKIVAFIHIASNTSCTCTFSYGGGSYNQSESGIVLVFVLLNTESG